MSKIKLDLREFKHLKSDDKSTTLQHKEGHILTLAHKSLSPESQAQLEHLAKCSGGQIKKYDEGGSVTPKPTGDKASKPVSNPDPYDQTLSNGWENIKKAFKAQGGMMEPDLSLPSDKTQYQEDAEAETKRYGAPVDQRKTVEPDPSGTTHLKAGQKMIFKAEGGDVDPIPEQGPTPVMTPDPSLASQQEAQNQAQTPTPAVQPQDPGLQAQKDLYNQKLAGAGVATTADDMFGPNGEPPKNPVNPQLWGQVENSSATQQLVGQQIADRNAINKSGEANQQQQALHDKAVSQNIVNAKLGLPLVPDPGSPQPQTQPGEVPPSGPATDREPANMPAQTGQPSESDPMGQYSGMLMGGYNKSMAGIAAQAKAQGDLGAQQAQMLQQKAANDQIAQDTFKQNFKDLNDERNNIVQDIKEGYVNPSQYWTGDKDGNGSHSKIMTGIGMILAGFNPANNPNAAIDFLKFNMEQNLNAQARNLGAKESLLSHNIRQFGNMRDAADMTRLMQNDMLSHQLGAAAAQAQSPLAKAAALQAQGKLQQEMAPLMMQLSMSRAMMGLARSANGGASPTGNPTGGIEAMLPMMRQMAPERAKEWEGRLVPGVGVANVPVTADDRKEIMGKTEFGRKAQQYVQFANQHSGSLNPALSAQGRVMALDLQNAYRNATHGGVFKEGEQAMIQRLIPDDPTQFLHNLRTDPKLKQLIQNNTQDLNTMKSQLGMAVPRTSQTEQGYRPKSFQPLK